MKILRLLIPVCCLLLMFSCEKEVENEDMITTTEEISSTRTVGCDMSYNVLTCVLNIECSGSGVVTFHDGNGNGPFGGPPITRSSPFTTAGGFGLPFTPGTELFIAPNNIGGIDERSFRCQ